MNGDKFEIKPRSKEKRVDLDTLNQYAITLLAITDFGTKQYAAVEQFLVGSSGRLRVQIVDFGGFSEESCDIFRSQLRLLTRFCGRVDFLEHVRIALSCDMHTESVMEELGLLAFHAVVKELSLYVSMTAGNEELLRFVEAVSSSWNRTLSIELAETLSDPITVLSKLHKNFSDGSLIPLVVTVFVASEAEHSVHEFLVDNGFEESCARDFYDDFDGVFAYEKERDGGWTMRVEYVFAKLGIEI
ncbi:hypothetical protein AAVH_33872, partial [Aphelenchoides avenae]